MDPNEQVRVAWRAELLYGVGTLAYRQAASDHTWPYPLFEESLELFRRSGNDRGTGNVLTALARIALRTGDSVMSRRLYDEALAMQRRLGHQAGVAAALHRLGRVVWLQGDYDLARARAAEALSISRAFDDPRISRPVCSAAAPVRRTRCSAWRRSSVTWPRPRSCGRETFWSPRRRPRPGHPRQLVEPHAPIGLPSRPAESGFGHLPNVRIGQWSDAASMWSCYTRRTR